MPTARLPVESSGSRLVVALALLAAGCGGSATRQDPVEDGLPADGVRAFFDPTLSPKRGNLAATWLGFPYPSDHRRTAAGTARLTDFPNPDAIPLLTDYAELGEAELDGFSLNAAVHLLFDGALDPATLPAAPDAFLALDAPLQLVDVTPGSPEYGQRRPLRWEYWPKTGRYVFAHSLAVAPSWGFPLRERTTYALIVTDAVEDIAGRPLLAPRLLESLLAGELRAPAVEPAVSEALYAELLAQFAPLRGRLALDRIDPERVAAATVFTTQGVTGPLAAIRAQVRARPSPALQAWSFPEGASASLHLERSFEWEPGRSADYYVMEGSFDAPNYQRGELPYAVEGGGLNFVDGAPAPVRTERLRFVLSFPKTPPAAGGCHPVVEVAHGTGGDAYSFFGNQTAARLAARGLAGIALDQPLHGPRSGGKSFDVDAMSFNYLNPEASRAVFRQSAIDTFTLTRFAQGSLKVAAASSPTGLEVCFDTTRLGFFGHSHGGLTGAIAAGLEHEVGSWVFSGAGGGLGITITERKDVMNVKEAISYLLGLGPSEPLSETHPVMTLIQTLVDVTDPINYATYWTTDPTFGLPSDVLLTSGLHDGQTPYRTATALAVAARIPALAPLALPIPEYEWAALPTAQAPLQANLGDATGGFLQWGPGAETDWDTHFVIFHRPEAIHASMRFLQSALADGAAVIERDPDSEAR